MKPVLDPKHTSGLAKQFFKDEKIETLLWPAYSPDLNVIENCWTVLKKKVRLCKPKNKTELWKVVKSEWETISPEYCANLTRDWGTKRLAKVIKAKGYSINK